MIHLAVGRGPSPLFGTAKLGTKKSPSSAGAIWYRFGIDLVFLTI